MRRQDKIKLLKDIAAGRKTIDEILPPIVTIWVQDKKDFGLFHCKVEELTKRWNELPYKIAGRVIDHIVMCLYGPSPIGMKSEYDVTLNIE